MNKLNIFWIMFFVLISFISASPLTDDSGKGNTLNNVGAFYNNSAFNYYSNGALNTYLNASMNQYIENFTFAITLDPNDDYIDKPDQALIYFSNFTSRDVNINYVANISHANYGRFAFTLKNSTFISLYPVSTKGLMNYTGAKRFAFTFNSTAIAIYIDGSFNQSIALNGGLARRNYTKLQLMADVSGGYGFNGSIDDVSLYNRSLSASEIVLDNASNFFTDLFGKYTFSNNSCIGGVTPIDSTIYSASNQLINFCSGSYNLPNGISITGNNVTLRGNNTLIYTTVLSNNTNGIILKKGTNNQVLNLNISGYGNCISVTDYNGVANNTRIINNTLKGCGAIAQLYIQATNNVTVENNNIMNSGNTGEGGTGSHGIYISSNGNASGKVITSGRIYNNFIYNNSASSFHINCQAGTNINNVLIQNNNMTSFTTDGFGVNLQCGNNITVDNNTISGASATCVQFSNIGDTYTNSTSVINSIVSNNNISNCTSRAFLVYGSTVNNSIVNNSIDRVYSNGVIMIAGGAREYNFNFEGVMPYVYPFYINSYIYFPTTHYYSPNASVNFNMSTLTSVSFSLTNSTINFTKLNSPNNNIFNVTSGSILTYNNNSYTMTLLSNQKIIIGNYTHYLITPLNIINPINNSNVNSYTPLNFTRTNFNLTNYYKVYLNNTLIYRINNVIENNYFEDIRHPTIPILISTTVLNSGVFNYSISLHAYSNRYCYAYLNIRYVNGSNINTPTYSIYSNTNNDVFYGIQNTYINESISNISFYGWSDGAGDCSGYLKIFTDSNNSNLNILPNWYNFTNNIGLYILNVSQFDYSNYLIDSNYANINFTANSLLNLSFFNVIGTPINIYNLSLTDSVTGVNINYSNSSNDIDVVKFRNYNYYVESPNYLNKSSSYLTSTSAYQQTNITLNYPNSVSIRIFNLSSGNLINSNTSFSVYSTSSAKYYSTIKGLYNLTYLDTGVNVFNFNNANFTPNSYSLDVVYGHDYSLDIYLLPIGSSSNVTFTIYNTNGAIVEGAFVEELILSNTSYLSVMSAYSDFNGKVYFIYNPSYYYKYIINDSRYVVSEFILNPPRDNNYDITLIPISSLITYDYLDVDGTYTFSNATDSLTFNYVSNEVGLSYEFLVYNKGTQICINSSNSSYNSFTCDLSNYEGSVYIYGLANDRIFYGGELVLGESKLSDYISFEEASFFSGIIFLLILLAGASLGIVVSLVMGIAALVIIVWLNIFTALNIGILATSIVVAIIIGLVVRRAR